MPVSFPGMDPYLEGAEWPGVHIELSAEIARQLAPKLRPKYTARLVWRFITDLDQDEVTINPERVYPVELATVIPPRMPEVTVEIRDVLNRTLVTAIEVLSPTNKRGEGYQEYLDKRGRLLHSPAHLLEIDLLRTGRRVPMQQPLPPAAYFVFLSRAERRPIVEVWPIQLTMRLPVVLVPLLADDPDVALDLQLALNTVYDALSYDLAVDYTRPPEMPLAGELAAWATERLRTAGLMKTVTSEP